MKAGVKDTHLHSSIQEVLQAYIHLWKERLPNRLEGLYLHGSIVLDAYNPNISDIDFAALTTRRLSLDELNVLSEIHTIIESRYTPKLDGPYLVWDDLGISTDSSEKPLPYYNEGEIRFGTHYNPVTWWLLKEKGITILGPDIKEKQFIADADNLRSYVMENMNSYWGVRVNNAASSIEELVQMPAREIDEEIEWTVLGLLRQYYTLNESGVISKSASGEYGVSVLPTEYHRIIREDINIRTRKGTSAYESNKQKIEESLRLSKFIIEQCNRNFNL
ncbi:DUF4111 domain-containing protein [Bacillus salacetis]|uniref:DUF4111 domain-containing protein n=1 Tax=Bacillus salacetis TaxID=2315464 RepID=A0A3A1QXU5_9BACI|nr:aminoglycoside adenylyltransferase domain-containing protein [Bacillus salacetis]RIW31966.1 DUF4111 domain-containing protein [Bacillus salacetis]